MTRRFSQVLAPMLLAALVLPVAANAADIANTVTGTGMATIEKPADTLRLQVVLQVEAPTLKDALAKLKTRREQVKAGLVKAGAVEKSIELGDPSVSDPNSSNDRSAMIQRAMRERMGGRG